MNLHPSIQLTELWPVDQHDLPTFKLLHQITWENFFQDGRNVDIGLFKTFQWHQFPLVDTQKRKHFECKIIASDQTFMP